MAQTSPLPEPTRVDNQDFVSGDGVEGPSLPKLGGDLGVGGNMDGIANSQAQMDIPFVYSDEELAVLAESFFNQRADFDPSMNNDWWNSGNL